MSAEQILITHGGYTDVSHPTCGNVHCTEAVLIAIGVPDSVLAGQGIDLSDLDIGNDTQVTVAPLGEQDSDVWCSTCGDFVQHGLNCDCPEEDGEKRDPASLDNLPAAKGFPA